MKKLICVSWLLIGSFACSMEKKLPIAADDFNPRNIPAKAVVHADNFNPRSTHSKTLTAAEQYFHYMNTNKLQESPEGHHGIQCTCQGCKYVVHACDSERSLRLTHECKIRKLLADALEEQDQLRRQLGDLKIGAEQKREKEDSREKVKEPKPSSCAKHTKECFCDACLRKSNESLKRLGTQLDEVRNYAQNGQVPNVNPKAIAAITANVRLLDKKLQNFSLLPKPEKPYKDAYVKPTTNVLEMTPDEDNPDRLQISVGEEYKEMRVLTDIKGRLVPAYALSPKAVFTGKP